MSDILYRPDLDYEKSYDTEGSFQSSTTDQSQDTSDSNKKSLDDIKDKLLRIKTILPSLPPDIAKAFYNVIKGASYIYDQIDPDNYDPDYKNSDASVVITPSTNPDITPTSNTDESDTEEEDEEDDGADGIFSDSIPLVDVKINHDDPVKAIEKEYDNTLASILEDYLNNVQTCVNKYHSKINVSFSEAGATSFKSLLSTYNVTTTGLKNKNLYHVADFVIRTQVVRNQKTRLIKKLFNLTETTSHVRACKVAKELKVRYYKEQKVKNNQYLDVVKNMMLSDSKHIYDKKYKENLYNLYKYLNSSVILIDECLSMFVQEAQAKLILMKEEGIKL